MSIVYVVAPIICTSETCVYAFFHHCASGNKHLQQFIRQLVSSTRDKQLVLLSIDLGEMLLPVEISVCLSVRLSDFVFILYPHV